MAYASLRLPEATGPRLRLAPSVTGLLCAVAVPSTLAAVGFSLTFHQSLTFRQEPIGTVLGGFVVFAMFGAMSILILFVPLLLWRLARSANPLSTCVILGIVSGPGPLGYYVLPYAPMIGLMTWTMGAIGGFLFWLVAVRTLPNGES